MCLRVEDGRCNERGGVRETKGGLGKHKLKALNVTAHSIALRHRSLLPILFAAFYNINNLENIAADCSEVAQRKKYVALCFYFFLLLSRRLRGTEPQHILHEGGNHTRRCSGTLSHKTHITLWCIITCTAHASRVGVFGWLCPHR